MRMLVTPAWPGLVSAGFLGLTSWRKKAAPPISRPATPPRFHSSVAPSAALYQATAASASGTITITEITGAEADTVPPDGAERPFGSSVMPPACRIFASNVSGVRPTGRLHHRRQVTKRQCRPNLLRSLQSPAAVLPTGRQGLVLITLGRMKPRSEGGTDSGADRDGRNSPAWDTVPRPGPDPSPACSPHRSRSAPRSRVQWVRGRQSVRVCAMVKPRRCRLAWLGDPNAVVTTTCPAAASRRRR